MGRDRSLDEFVGGEPEDSADAGEDGPADSEDIDSSDAETDPEPTSEGGGSGDPDAAGDDDTTATVPDGVDPAAVTYCWEPEGVRCSDCGATVETLWSGESGQVCAECKEW